MLNSTVSSYILKINPVRKAKAIKLQDRFSSEGDKEDSGKDIIDVIAGNLSNGTAFKIPRYGTGTAADREGTDAKQDIQSLATHGNLSEDNAKDSDTQSSAFIQLVPKEEIAEDGITKKDNPNALFEVGKISESGEILGKYVYFTVLYGENGDRGTIKKAGHAAFSISPDDFYCRVHHVMIAFLNDSKDEQGYVYFESRGNHGVVRPMTNVIRESARVIDNAHYTVRCEPFFEDAVYDRMINYGAIKEVTVVVGKKPAEHKEPIEYAKRNIVYCLPRSKNLREYLKGVLDKGVGFSSTSTKEEEKQFAQGDPETIKFKIQDLEDKHERVFTAGKIPGGCVQEEMNDVVMADGFTNHNRLKEKWIALLKKQHINNE